MIASSFHKFLADMWQQCHADPDASRYPVYLPIPRWSSVLKTAVADYNNAVAFEKMMRELQQPLLTRITKYVEK